MQQKREGELMYLNPAAGLYVFEVVLGFRADGRTQYSPPCLIQADDPEEAEEKVMEFLCELDLEQDFWIDQMSEPVSIQDYQVQVRQNERETLPVLDELNEVELKEYLGFLL